VSRHAIVTIVALAACGPQQTRPTRDETPVPTPIDAAPTPVVVVPADAGPPPEVPPLAPASVDELRAKLNAATTNDEQLIYLSQLAELEWAALCAAPTDGLCFTKVKRAKKAPLACNHHESVQVTARPFDGVREVTKLLGEVRQRWGGGSAIHEITDPGAQADAYVANFHMTQQYAATLLIAGDQAFEAFLAVKPLSGLDFDPGHGGMEKKSLQRFEAYFQDLVSLGTEAMLIYEMVTTDPEITRFAPAAQVSGYARMIQLSQRFADNLREMEVPTNIRKDSDLTQVFCDALDEKAEPFVTQSAELKYACTQVAAEHDLSADRCGP